ncbi:MAG: hypothetical protein ACRDOF_04160 [Gaiellaceae bacterium]|nr:hypothetical protein [Gaiellaceae bacterium]HLE99628.1 hypothetical protein [Gaiellaceae bacterium]
MKLQKQIKTAAALALSALAVAGPAAAGTPLDSYRDGPERHSALTSAEAAIAYFRANERATAATSGDAAIAYFYANERSQGPVASEALVGYVDGPERGALLRSTTPVSVGLGSDDGGFDWGAAAVGATSVLMFGLLIGGSLSVKHFRGGRLTH